MLNNSIFGAVAKGCLSEIEKTLKDNDINALNSSRETLLHVAAANGHLAVMEYLISRGAKPDVKDKKGRTPLHRAAEKGHGDAVKVLLQVRLNAVTKELVTPLHVASQRGNTDVAQQLLQHKASVNAKDRQAKSPLHYASEKGDETMVEMLLDANADPNAQDKEKRTPLHAAAEGGHLGLYVSVGQVQIYYSCFFMLTNPVTRLDIIQPGEWWGLKALLRECCCLQGTTGLCTNVQYQAWTLFGCVLYPIL
uniref:Ankyrin-1 n=1 Tax=Anas platyrhynchos TaxID=8839 RepID=A0A8B9TQH5_ANAPL